MKKRTSDGDPRIRDLSEMVFDRLWYRDFWTKKRLLGEIVREKERESKRESEREREIEREFEQKSEKESESKENIIGRCIFAKINGSGLKE